MAEAEERCSSGLPRVVVSGIIPISFPLSLNLLVIAMGETLSYFGEFCLSNPLGYYYLMSSVTVSSTGDSIVLSGLLLQDGGKQGKASGPP